MGQLQSLSFLFEWGHMTNGVNFKVYLSCLNKVPQCIEWSAIKIGQQKLRTITTMNLSSCTPVLFFCFLVLLPFSTSAQSSTNVITIGSSLLANNQNSSWTSPSGDFAFGFQNINGPPAGGYLLSIWFNKIPDKTVVWSANPQTPAPEGSKIELTNNSFHLTNPNGSQIWFARLAGISLSNAAMLDSGNFVILGNNSGSTTLWQSFDEPTDTILPTQTLSQGMRLVARLLDTNFSNGRFQLDMQSDGNLVLYTRRYPLDGVYSSYWASDSVGSGFQLIYNETGYVYLTGRNGTILENLFRTNNNNPTQFYVRTILEYDGVLRQYVYPKSADSAAGRSMAWSVLEFIPSDICTSILQKTGPGVCGYNSFCAVAADQRPTCECPSGYTRFDSNDPLSGCKPNFVKQDCQAEGQESHNFGFINLDNTDWPLNDYEDFNPVTEDWCREACLSDCYCDVAIFRDGQCWKKRTPVSNGRVDPSVGGKALVKIRRANSTTPSSYLPLPLPPPAGAGDGPTVHNRRNLIAIVSVLFGSSMFLNIVLIILATFCFIKRKKGVVINGRPDSAGTGRSNLRFFSYKELEIATRGFKDELGRGAFGVVYKGVLRKGNDEDDVIAVKMIITKDMEENMDREFKAEMDAISRTNHKNLVQLLGYCDEGKNRLLVYEYMSNGSLADFIFGSSSRPSWNTRMQIGFGIARGLSYLHEECTKQIIHCDIKPQNVLLDQTYTARICDFGLAKLLKTGQSHTNTVVRGTKGYVAPEWFKNMAVTAKVDVYSFGVMLLELICCRKNVDDTAMCEEQIILSDWAFDCFRDGEICRLVEEDEEAMKDFAKVERLVMIALWCIQEEPSLRPGMKKVSQMLEGAVAVSIPPYPCSFISSI